jgi:hypothetical protein
MLATSVTTTLNFDAAGLFPLPAASTHLMEQVMDTLADIDQALTYLNQVPVDERGAAWRAYLDAVLDQRKESEQ